MKKENLRLVTLAVGSRMVKCRRPGNGETMMFRPRRGTYTLVEGEVVHVQPEKTWMFGSTEYLSGVVLRQELDVKALELKPLRLFPRDIWNPREEMEWEELTDDPEYSAVMAAGARPAYEMEQVIPGQDPNNPFDDPITAALDAYEAGDYDFAYETLQKCLAEDLRCIDAHVHLGYFSFQAKGYLSLATAIRHYRVGVAIGELTVGQGFYGVLPWSYINNRPFLRCLHGLGVCWWRLGEQQRARQVFSRLLWLNPPDEQGVRVLLEALARGETWEDMQEDETYII